MKKISRVFLFGLFIFVFVTSVQAESYAPKTLIPVDTIATVDTDLFTYQDFVYHSAVDDKGNATITFNQIVNHTDKKVPISVNILLFNDKQQNIGYLTYCTDKDLDSDYNNFKIDKQQSVPFTINVTSRYFATHTEKGEVSNQEIPYTPGEVKYIAIMDENKYCTVGGYDKYAELTMDEIIGGKVVNNEGYNRFVLKKFMKLGSVILILSGLAVLVAFYVNGLILNALHKRMFHNATALAYFPITNFYVMGKVCFGGLIAKISIPLYFLFCLFGNVGIGIISSYSSLCFILVIVKLITKKYDLLYFGTLEGYSSFDSSNYISSATSDVPAKKDVVNEASEKNDLSGGSDQIIDLSYQSDTEKNTNDMANQVIDLNYHGEVPNDTSGIVTSGGGNATTSNVDDLFTISTGESMGDVKPDAPAEKKEEQNLVNSKDGESDLSKFFK